MSLATQTMPKGVVPLYIIKMFSTFSFAVLFASLSLYITQQLGLSSTVSNAIVGLFLACNYVLHLAGGLIGGRYLSNRCLFLSTAILQTTGIVLLAFVDPHLLYIGLSLYLVGCGLNATCLNTILTQRFTAEDNRRDKAFYYLYAAMNTGFCGGFFLSGFYDYSNQYQTLFYICVLTDIVSLLLLLSYWKALADKETILTTLSNTKNRHIRQWGGIVGIILLLPGLMLSLTAANISNFLVLLLGGVMFFVILSLALRQKNRSDKEKLMAYLMLAVTSVIFWMIYFTGPMGVTLFLKNNVDKQLWGYKIATQWIVNLNSITIIVGAPLLAMLLNKFQARGIKISVSMQFFSAFIILALSFYLLSWGVMAADVQGYSSIHWAILHFITQAIAELMIGPVGYAMIGRIAPARLQGLLMGTWMMVSGVAASLSHYFSNAMVRTEATDPLMTNPDYLHVFNQLGAFALAGGIFLYLIAGKIRKLIDSTDSVEAAIAEDTVTV